VLLTVAATLAERLDGSANNIKNKVTELIWLETIIKHRR
jgi:hypothetical protein